ncbi:mRNA cap guanine-N7 methyltransferase [Myotisia sp. PD_48]|nr:mRNA cap guanine-N7 methyltransferase [Myotisia sp. PD_48]
MYDPARDIFASSDKSSPVHKTATREPTIVSSPASQEDPPLSSGASRSEIGQERPIYPPPGQDKHAKSTTQISESGHLRSKPTVETPGTTHQLSSNAALATIPNPPSQKIMEHSADAVSRTPPRNPTLDSSKRTHPDPSKRPQSPSVAHNSAKGQQPHGIPPPSTLDSPRDAFGNERKRKTIEQNGQNESNKLEYEPPRTKRRRQEERLQKGRNRGKSPPSAYSRRDDSQPSHSDRFRGVVSRKSRSPSPIRRTPSPDAPVRQRKRPGGGARINAAHAEAVRRRQEERERQAEEDARRAAIDRGVHDVVRQHYNAVPERGREWRKTESKIKGLRTFNNWVKSTLIQKFSPDEDFLAKTTGNKNWGGDGMTAPEQEKRLLVVDLGCGKGGDLMKWNQAPQPVELYVGLDPAEVSLDQARDRWIGMKKQRSRGGRRGHPLFHAEFTPKDCFGEWLGDVPIIQDVGIDGNVGPDGNNAMSSRWGGGGFDVVVSMFTMHYAFENETKARQMLQNVAGLLKKGGRFIGVGPNSDVISAKVAEAHKQRKEREASKSKTQEDPEDGEVEDNSDVIEWGNDIYRVRFPGKTPEDGIFRPAFGWKYFYFLEEAVEEIPEYVVPWEAFRALTEDYNLELQYRKPFLDIWKEEKDDPDLGPLSERMGVQKHGEMLVNDAELEAASLYHAFCFYKV